MLVQPQQLPVVAPTLDRTGSARMRKAPPLHLSGRLAPFAGLRARRPSPANLAPARNRCVVLWLSAPWSELPWEGQSKAVLPCSTRPPLARYIDWRGQDFPRPERQEKQ